MKRKLFAIWLVLALLASAYTAYACLSTRGLRVYLMGTRMGAIFAGTWQFALLAAVILWALGAIVLIREIRGLLRRRPVPAGVQISSEIMTAEEDPEATELLEPRKSAEETTELLEPRRSAEETTELLEPRRSAEEATEFLEPQESAERARELPKPAAERTAAPVRGEPSQRFCPNCGHPVSGKKFCARCGTKVGE